MREANAAIGNSESAGESAPRAAAPGNGLNRES
jgi:hypothetical protein